VAALTLAAALLLTAGERILAAREALDARVGDAAGDQLDRADRVVVARDDEVDRVRIAVRVGDGEHGDAELLRLGDGDRLLVRVDDEDRVREGAHVLEAAEVLLEALALLLELRDFLLRKLLVGAVFLHALEVAQAIEATLDGAEVRQRAAEPAVRDVVHAGARGLLGDDLLGLALGADEEDVTALAHGLDEEVVRALEHARRLVEVDDVDAVARAVDERTHLRVPALGLVAEVNAGFDERANRERHAAGGGGRRSGDGGAGLGHGCFLFFWLDPPVPSRSRPTLVASAPWFRGAVVRRRREAVGVSDR
jgi:hypothetical protein